MNKRHRDRVAFLRVCSGVFEKDMVITNAREGQEIRAARPYRFFGGKRETIDRAFPGDVVGLVNPGQFGIGDTLYADVPVKYPPIPRFPAEHFGVARLRDVRFKQFDEAIRQLEEEGLMQVLFPTIGRREPILGTVGPLQLEVLAVRLKDEYNVEADVDSLSYTSRALAGGSAEKIAAMSSGAGTRLRHRSPRPAGDAVRIRVGARLRAAQPIPTSNSSRSTKTDYRGAAEFLSLAKVVGHRVFAEHRAYALAGLVVEREVNATKHAASRLFDQPPGGGRCRNARCSDRWSPST